jgi:tetratricopeptide (TPR) repeat protein
MGWLPALRETWQGVRVALRNFWSAYLLLGNLSLIAFVAVSAAGAAFLLALALKYQPLLRHDLCEWLGRRRMPEAIVPVCAWALFLLPLLAGLGWMWVLLAWSVAAFPYARRSERALATLVLLWGVAALPATRLIGGMFQTSVNPEVRNLVAAMRGGYDPARVRFLRESVARDPENPLTQFLLGALYKAGGYLNESLVHYKRSVALDPRLHQATNNLGNLYYLTQNFALAQQQYQQAVELRPDFAIGFFNLHLAQYQQFNVEEAERSLETALRLDPHGLGAARRSDLPRSVVDARLDLDELWPSVAARARAGGAAAGMPGSWTHPITLAAAGAGVIAWTGAARRRKRRARRCFKCGKPFCSACRSGAQFPDFCTQCVHLFAKRDGLAPATKKAKIAEVQRYAAGRRRLSRLLSAMLPGLGHVWADRATLGFLGMLAWALSLLAFAGHDRLLRFYEVAYADARSLAPVLAAMGAALTWAVMNLVSPVRKD